MFALVLSQGKSEREDGKERKGLPVVVCVSAYLHFSLSGLGTPQQSPLSTEIRRF